MQLSSVVPVFLLFCYNVQSDGRIACPSGYDCVHLNRCHKRHGDDLHHMPPLHKCSRNEKFCCPQKTSTTLCLTPTTPPTNPETLSLHPSMRLLPPPTTCGQSSEYMFEEKFTENKILNGRLAHRGAVPWMVLLYYGPRDDQDPYIDDFHDHLSKKEWPGCGGTLISSRYVLTAAHCLKFSNNQTVLKHVTVGGHNVEESCEKIRQLIEIYQPTLKPEKQCPINVMVDKVIVHPRFNESGKLKNDIGLLRLSDDVMAQGNKFISLACLPFPNFKTVHLSEVFLATGWGARKYYENEFPRMENTLRTVNITGSGICNICGEFGPSVLCDLNNYTQLCVQGENPAKDVCKGDSGGPLMVWRDDRWVQVGIVSAKPTEHCGAQGVPSIYTRVDGFLDWILDNMAE